jgi:hypothetical protein
VKSETSETSETKEDWGYPGFAKDFPPDPELEALVAAFARGDYLAVRERAPRLAESTTDEAVRKAARLLRQRIEPDPASRILFAIAAALLALLTTYWVLHKH